MKKRFIVRFTFVGEFEAENDSDALGSAAHAVRWGVESAQHMELKVVAALPMIATEQEQKPQPGAEIGNSQADQTTKDDHMPF